MHDKYPLGRRGERPVFFAAHLPWEESRLITNIPGVEKAPGGFVCTWDCAPILARALGQPCPPIPSELFMTDAQLVAEVAAFPGLQRFRDLGLSARLRDYQKDGAIFLARRAYAMGSDPMRAGKTLQALAASVLVDAKRTLIVCPALAKFVWADEIAKWLKEEALILEGRSGDYARQFCLACDARGEIKKPDGSAERCEACKLRNGQSNGYRLYDTKQLKGVGPQGEPEERCRKHPEVYAPAAGTTQDCPKCLEAVHEQIERSKYVIVNYDLLVAQKMSDGAGRGFYRQDLQGWGPTLASHSFDLCIADECHQLRGWSSDVKKRGTTRREKFNQATENIERVWGLTGTPVFGYVRDLWGQFDSLSKGAMTGRADRLPFTFHVAYCDGGKHDVGWKADGRSPAADTDLPERLSVVKIQRPRSMILSALPPKLRQVIRVDDSRPSKNQRFGGAGGNTGKITRLLRSTFEAKLDTVVEHVLTELAEGNKVVVFTLLKDSANRLAQAIERESQKRDYRTKMREVDLKVWMAHGEVSSQGRFEMARAYREHMGAAAFVTTIDAVQVAVSLKGASSVHFAELHWQPAALLQAEDRPYELGVSGLSIVYYIVRGSVDEHVEQVVLPKVDTLSRIVAEKGADEMRIALQGDHKETLDELLSALTAHLKLSSLGE